MAAIGGGDKGGLSTLYYDFEVVTVTTVLTGVMEDDDEVAGVLLEAWEAELTAAPLSAPLTALMTDVATEVAAVLMEEPVEVTVVGGTVGMTSWSGTLHIKVNSL